MSAPTITKAAPASAAPENALAAWLAARPDMLLLPVTLPDGRACLTARRDDAALLAAARDLALLTDSASGVTSQGWGVRRPLARRTAQRVGMAHAIVRPCPPV